MEPEALRAILLSVLDETQIDGDASHLATAEIDAITDIAQDFTDTLEDGFQLSDLAVLGKLVPPFMELAATFNDLEGAQKRAFVTEIFYALYRIADGLKGENRINLPFVFGKLEELAEKKLAQAFAGLAIESAYIVMKRHNEV